MSMPPSNGEPGGGGGDDGGGGFDAAALAAKLTKNTTKEIKILFGTKFIVRKSKKKIYSPK